MTRDDLIGERELINDQGVLINVVHNGLLRYPRRWRWVCSRCHLFGFWEDRIQSATEGGYEHLCNTYATK